MNARGLAGCAPRRAARPRRLAVAAALAIATSSWAAPPIPKTADPPTADVPSRPAAASAPAERPGQLDKPVNALLAPLVPQLKFGLFRQHVDVVQRSFQLPPTADPRDFGGRYSPLEATLLLPGERGRMASYTDRGARTFLARAQAFLAGQPRPDPLTLCKPGGPVRALNEGFPVQVVQTSAEITIVHMQDHLVRRIHLGGPRVAQPAPSAMGYSRGHWEGNTLVVETRAFRDGGWMDDYGDPSSGQLMLLERYTKQPNGSLRIEATINDPVYYSEPIRLVRNWAWTPNVAWNEVICEAHNRDAPPVGR